MCEFCGCGSSNPGAQLQRSEPDGHGLHAHTAPDGTVYYHRHAQSGQHPHTDQQKDSAVSFETVTVQTSVLAYNDRIAAGLRTRFAALGVRVINLMSAPGSGKTALIEVTVEHFHRRIPCAVIVGDLATENDAARIRKKGVPVVQITTGTACHLDALMISTALERLSLSGLRLLFIENVGNLVCPATFDLGEDRRVVLLSVPEGEDKPLKYPPIFHRSDLVLITKTDLVGVLGFDLARARQNIRSVAPHAEVLEVSVRTGAGLEQWFQFIERGAAVGE